MDVKPQAEASGAEPRGFVALFSDAALVAAVTLTSVAFGARLWGPLTWTDLAGAAGILLALYFGTVAVLRRARARRSQDQGGAGDSGREEPR